MKQTKTHHRTGETYPVEIDRRHIPTHPGAMTPAEITRKRISKLLETLAILATIATATAILSAITLYAIS